MNFDNGNLTTCNAIWQRATTPSQLKRFFPRGNEHVQWNQVAFSHSIIWVWNNNQSFEFASVWGNGSFKAPLSYLHFPNYALHTETNSWTNMLTLELTLETHCWHGTPSLHKPAFTVFFSARPRPKNCNTIRSVCKRVAMQGLILQLGSLIPYLPKRLIIFSWSVLSQFVCHDKPGNHHRRIWGADHVDQFHQARPDKPNP